MHTAAGPEMRMGMATPLLPRPVRAAWAGLLAAVLIAIASAAVPNAAGGGSDAWRCGGKTFLPTWSPDGREIAFTCEVSSSTEALAVVDVASGAQRRLVQGLVDTFSWSPDGARIAYGDTGIFTIRRDGTGRRRVRGPSYLAGFPLWSPDGRTILFIGGSELDGRDHWRAVPAAGGRTRPVAVAAFSSSPAWSPDSRRIAFERASGDANLPATGSQIAVVGRDGKGLRVLTRGEGLRYYPVWSARGAQIAFELHRRNKRSAIVLMRSDGTRQRVLTEGSEPQFSPRGARILFAGKDGGLWTMGTDGTGLRRLTEDGNFPTWSPNGQRVAFLREGIWVMDADGGHQRRLVP
jgi:TolB protein